MIADLSNYYRGYQMGGGMLPQQNALAAPQPTPRNPVTVNPGVVTDGVDPALQSAIYEAMSRWDGPGEWRVTEGMRTPERQSELYAQGRTAPGEIVTNTLASDHLKGEALDVALVDGGNALWDFNYYDQLNALVQQIAAERGLNITWGGDWKMRDGPHFQLD